MTAEQQRREERNYRRWKQRRERKVTRWFISRWEARGYHLLDAAYDQQGTAGFLPVCEELREYIVNTDAECHRYRGRSEREEEEAALRYMSKTCVYHLDLLTHATEVLPCPRTGLPPTPPRSLMKNVPTALDFLLAHAADRREAAPEPEPE